MCMYTYVLYAYVYKYNLLSLHNATFIYVYSFFLRFSFALQQITHPGNLSNCTPETDGGVSYPVLIEVVI